MSCEECEAIQTIWHQRKAVYVRIDDANVELVGCDKHVKDAIAVIRIGTAHLHYLIEKGELLDKKYP